MVLKIVLDVFPRSLPRDSGTGHKAPYARCQGSRPRSLGDLTGFALSLASLQR
eukprot:COSAG02_NODE_5023_length_4719_cov_21.132900_1_plen_53_part_00